MFPCFQGGRLCLHLAHIEDLLGQIPPLTAGVHLGRPRNYLPQAIRSAVVTSLHPPTNTGEQFEVTLLSGKHGIGLEVGNNPLQQKRQFAYLPLERAITPIRPERAAPEVRLDGQ